MSTKAKVKDVLLKIARESYQLKAESDRVATISPTPYETIDIIINDLEYLFLNEGVLYICDIGCGDGRWLLSLAKKHFCVCLGLEIEKERLLKAKQMYEEVNNNMKGVVEFVHANFLNVSLDLKILDIVIIYLSRKGNEAVKQKLEKECKIGTIIIAIGFQLKDMVYQKRYDVKPPAYIYHVG